MAAPTAPLLFVSVAAYNDPELLPTLHDAYAKAAHPEQLRFGVVDQCVEDRCEALPTWKEQIRSLWMRARDARGVGFARSIIPGMMERAKRMCCRLIPTCALIPNGIAS